MIGTRLGNYEILEELGRGGMGCVYKARQTALDRIVAVKVLLPQLTADKVFVERFLREARSIATLDHPGIVTVFDVGEADGTYYFAMQLLDGKPLDEILEGGKPMPVETAVDVIEQVARALEFAHEAGILHRDVKPGNIILTSSGRAVLTDFGIAQALTDTRLTKTGTSIGSPEYMSPEQIEGKQLDARADLYSLGVVFYQMLTGNVPYKGDSPVAIVYQHVKAPVPSARDTDPTIPERFDLVATTLMAKLPEERYASAEELLSGLAGKVLDRGPKIDRKPGATVPGWAWGAIGVVALLGAGLIWLGRSATPESPTPPNGSVAGETTAPTADQVGLEIEPVAATAPPTPSFQTFTVTSAPAGAAVILDGSTLEAVTPATIELLPDTAYELGLRLDGHDPTGMSFTLADLSDSQRSSATLHFPLQSSIPPGSVAITADYPVTVRVDGRSYTSKRFDLPPGDYTAQITARSVFLSESRRISIASGKTQTIALPIATRLTIAANPSRCRVKIDGMDAGYLPSEVQVTLGNHVFEFDWESLGKSISLTRKITPQTDRVFAAAPR